MVKKKYIAIVFIFRYLTCLYIFNIKGDFTAPLVNHVPTSLLYP